MKINCKNLCRLNGGYYFRTGVCSGCRSSRGGFGAKYNGDIEELSIFCGPETKLLNYMKELIAKNTVDATAVSA